MQFWHLLTRLGEAQILLPLALLAGLAGMRQAPTRARALRWGLLLLGATALTTLTKVAFIGWGVGWRAVDFTGISGHAMFASAVYPVLFDAAWGGGTGTGTGTGQARRWAVPCGCALALLIGISRVVVGAHSVSEVILGLLLGGAVSAAVLMQPTTATRTLGPLPAAAAALWLVFMPLQASASRTHAMVTQVALQLSGHARPHTRAVKPHGPRLRWASAPQRSRPVS